jgi:hypothetical protein
MQEAPEHGSLRWSGGFEHTERAYFDISAPSERCLGHVHTER